ncbi:Nn.00g064340.m01.CDS01 [Neocucurbitaria sp. VM-36]
MGTDYTGAVSRARRNLRPPAKQITPLNAKKSVSVAAIFKQRPHETKQVDIPSHTRTTVTRQTAEDVTVAKSMSVKSQCSSRDAQNAGWRVSKKKSDLHPLAVAFRETSDDYRRHLFESTMLKVNDTLETLLTSLFESTLQTISINGSERDHDASPLKLSAPAKYERMSIKLHEPLSHYQLTLQRTNSEGERERFQATLETRMIHYEEHLTKRAHEVVQLQKEWETVVGEIWKLGVSCLGEGVMEKLLFTDQGALGPLSSPSKATDAESTLFVPEQGSSTPPRKAKAPKKHVTFEASRVHDEYGAASLSEFPQFLYQPSRYEKQPLPTVPLLADAEVKTMEREVKQLGIAQIEELRKIEKDYQEYWRKKTAQLAVVLKDE